MRYTITIDKQITPNTFDSVMVCCTDNKEAFEECWRTLSKAFACAKSLQKILWKFDEEFCHVNMEIKL